MKKSKHLPLNLVKINCITCDSNFNIYTTLKKDFKIDVCSACHPFYIGTQKFESKAGRVERFRRLQRKKSDMVNQPIPTKVETNDSKKEIKNVQ